MLSAPGLRFHRALAPFLQLDVGPAHPAVGGVVGYTPFIVVLLCSFIFSLFFYYFYLYSAYPCLPWVPRVGFFFMHG